MTEGSERWKLNTSIEFIDETFGDFSKSFIGWITEAEIKLQLINFHKWPIVKEMRMNSQSQQNT